MTAVATYFRIFSIYTIKEREERGTGAEVSRVSERGGICDGFG
jgi:hypothetical protein